MSSISCLDCPGCKETGSASARAAVAAAGGYDEFADAENDPARAGRGRDSHASGTRWTRVLRGQVCEKGSSCTGSRRSWTLVRAYSFVGWLACLECPREEGHSC